MSSSLLDEDWIIGGDFNMVEWEGDRGGGACLVVGGAKNKAWSMCKDSLPIFYPNWEKKFGFWELLHLVLLF
jgi:hypothetical protein